MDQRQAHAPGWPPNYCPRLPLAGHPRVPSPEPTQLVMPRRPLMCSRVPAHKSTFAALGRPALAEHLHRAPGSPVQDGLAHLPGQQAHRLPWSCATKAHRIPHHMHLSKLRSNLRHSLPHDGSLGPPFTPARGACKQFNAPASIIHVHSLTVHSSALASMAASPGCCSRTQCACLDAPPELHCRSCPATCLLRPTVDHPRISLAPRTLLSSPTRA